MGSLRMTTPTKHPKTGTYRLRVAVPADLRDTTGRLYGQRRELQENLGTKDAREAKSRAGAALARLHARLQAARATRSADTASLSERDVAALAGVFYRDELARFSDGPGDPAGWEAETERLSDQVDPDPGGSGDVTLSRHDIADATALLTSRGLPADPATVRRLGLAVYRARWDLARLMERRAEGDWTPDKAAARYPEPTPRAAAPQPPAAPGVTFGALVAGWGRDHGWSLDAKPINRSLYDRKTVLDRLEAFLGHDDAARVTKADAIRFKEARQAEGVHSATVTNDLSACSAVWRWGQRMGRLPADGMNPFAGIAPPKAKKGTVKRAFSDEEAGRVLAAARKEKGWLRWLPWLLCLTGVRLNEACQSVKEDVAVVDGVTVLRVHDDADGRSIKNEESRRDVPLHPALIAEGFGEYVAKLRPGSPLFPDLASDGIFGRRAALATKNLGYWTRRKVGIEDPRISPAHSWRHWFIGACRRVVMPQEVRSAITGHSAKADESAGYGDGMKTLTAVMAEYVAKVVPPPIPG